MDDILPEDFELLNQIIQAVRRLFKLYGYCEIETPPVEYYEIFAAKSGEEILEHMYVFTDRHNRRLVLRPEMTVPVARLVAGKMSRRPLPLRLGYIADCYRLDEPQWGRRRRFYHGGFELFGSREPVSDVEILQVVSEFFRNLNIADYSFKIGNVGIHRSLMDEAGINEDEQDRILSLIDRGRINDAIEFARKNAKDPAPLKIVEELISLRPDKAEKIIPNVINMMDRYEKVRSAALNLLEIVELASKVIDEDILIYHPGFSRGLGYYTGLIFEVYGPLADIALAGGGRYDKLVELFGGRPIPSVGAAIGITRVYQYLSDRLGRVGKIPPPEVYVAPLTKNAWGISLLVSRRLREEGITTEVEVSSRNISDTIKTCERRGIRFLVIIGDREVEQSQITLRDLDKREQNNIPIAEIERVIKIIKEGK